MYVQKRKIVADTEPGMVADEELELEGGAAAEAEVTVEPEASDLLFEAEDVAELVAEITGMPVDVTVDDNIVEFAVGENVYTIEAEGDEEVLETARKPMKGKKPVAASTNRRPAPGAKKPAAPAAPAGRTVRSMGRRK